MFARIQGYMHSCLHALMFACIRVCMVVVRIKLVHVPAWCFSLIIRVTSSWVWHEAFQGRLWNDKEIGSRLKSLLRNVSFLCDHRAILLFWRFL